MLLRQVLLLILAFTLIVSPVSSTFNGTIPVSTAIYGRVVTDTNNNNIADPFDVGVAGVYIYFVENGHTIATDFTDSNGEYHLFTHKTGTFILFPSVYTIPNSYTFEIGEVGGSMEYNFIKTLAIFLPTVSKN